MSVQANIDFIIDNYNTENNMLNELVKDVTIPILNTWRTNINHTSYEFIDEFLSNVFVNKEGVNMFKEYIINILDNKENHYGVLIIPGFVNGDCLLDILRQCLGDYYNRYDNSRDAKERLIRHDGDNSIKVIKKNQHCHHVYLWNIDVTNMKTFYEKNKIGYTLCDICDTQHFLKYRKDCGYNKEFPKDAVFSMLNNYFEKNIKK